MLTEALVLSAIGIAVVFLFLGLLVFAVKGMSACGNLIVKPAPDITPGGVTQAQRQRAAVAASTLHHHRLNER